MSIFNLSAISCPTFPFQHDFVVLEHIFQEVQNCADDAFRKIRGLLNNNSKREDKTKINTI